MARKTEQAFILGKPKDGITRITRTETTTVQGGSQEGHERATETAIRMEEGLERDGKTLRDVSCPHEWADRIADATRRTG